MMLHCRDINKSYKSTHEDFTYYEAIIEKVEENIQKSPDISIESCKSLIEGISKTILLRLDVTQTQTKVDKLDFPELYRQVCWALQRHSQIEVDYIHRTSAMIQRLAELRTRRGDISHGKAVPKIDRSTISSAKMIMVVTDAIAHYMLEAFFRIDLSYKEDVKYADCEDFNFELYEINPLKGLSYSRALFDQDNVTYMELLREFNDRKAEEAEAND
jgi:ribosomal protein S13